MASKRKAKEIDTKNAKKSKSRIFSYIEDERQKLLLNRESLKSIEKDVRRNLKLLNNSDSLRRGASSDSDLMFVLCRLQVMRSTGRSTKYHYFSIMWPMPMRNIAGNPVFNCVHESANVQTMTGDIAFLYTTFNFYLKRVPSCKISRIFLGALPLYRGDLYGIRRNTPRNCNTRSDPMRGSHYSNSSITRNDLLGAKLIALLRNWKVTSYKECIFEYRNLYEKNTEFWTQMVLKVFPPVMLEHCSKSDIMADFFHIMCQKSETINALVKLNPSYTQFFLLNMAAANRIEYSEFLHSENWHVAKQELLGRAFLAGQVDNLRLFLQYFRPKCLWLSPEMKFPEDPTLEEEDIDNIEVAFFNRYISFNLIRIAICVTVSTASPDSLADCIRLYWRASDTPYVSLAHINDAYALIDYNAYYHASNHLSVLKASKDCLLRVYPKDCLAEYQPRSLRHLSRCKIRQSIVTAAHSHFLPLPDKLRKYIDLEW